MGRVCSVNFMEKKKRILITEKAHIAPNAHVAGNLLVGSIMAALATYLVLARYQLQKFQPIHDLSSVIPLYIPEYRPETEVSLYLASIIFIPGVGLGFYFMLQKLVGRFSPQKQGVRSGVFLRAAILFVIAAYVTSVVVPHAWYPEALGTLLAVAFFVVYIVFFPITDTISNIHSHFLALFDWTLAIGAIIATSFFAYRFAFDQAFTRNLIDQARISGYVYMNDISARQVVGVSVILGVIAMVWMNTKKFFLIIQPLHRYLVHVVIFTGIIFGVSIVAVNGWGSPYYVIPSYNTVMGAVNDALGGKTLLVNIRSQYGLLLIPALSVVFRFIPLTYKNFFWLNFVITVVGYSLLYIILKRWLGWIAVLGLLLIFEHHYFAGTVHSLLTSGQTFLRWGGWIVLLFYIFIMDTKNIRGRLRMIGELFLVGIFTFWGFEVGIYTLGAYVSMRLVAILLDELSAGAKVRTCIYFTLQVFVILTLFFISISALIYARSNVWPDWTRYSHIAKQFMSGLYMMPMPALGPYAILLALYVCVLTYILYTLLVEHRRLSRMKAYDTGIITYITVYGILQFTYFVGRSSASNIPVVVIPAILLICWLLQSFHEHYQVNGLRFSSMRTRWVFRAFVFTMWIAASTVMTVGTVNMFEAYRKRTNLQSLSFDHIAYLPPYKEAIDGIQTYLAARSPSAPRILPIISMWDGFFLIKTQSVSVIESNNMDYFVKISQLKELAHQLKTANPERFFADHENTFDIIPYILDDLNDSYRVSRNFGYLDEWVKK